LEILFFAFYNTLSYKKVRIGIMEGIKRHYPRTGIPDSGSWARSETGRGCIVFETKVKSGDSERPVILSRNVEKDEPFRLYFAFQIHESNNVGQLIELLKSLSGITEDELKEFKKQFNKYRLPMILSKNDPYS
jgi:hypothetical protein